MAENLQEGVDVIYWLVDRLAALKDVADTLRRVGSLDQMLADRAHIVEVHAAEAKKLQDLRSQIAAAEADLAAFKKSHAEEEARHRSELASAVDDAQAKAAAIIADADKQGKTAINAAKAEFEAIRSRHTALKAQLEAELEAKRSDIKAAEDRIAAAKAEHDKMKAKTDKLREFARSLAG